MGSRPKREGEMRFDTLTTLRKLEGRIISVIDQPDVIKWLDAVGVRSVSDLPRGRCLRSVSDLPRSVGVSVGV